MSNSLHPLHVFKCILEGDIVIDSLILANTSGALRDLLTGTHPTAGKLALKRPRGEYDDMLIAVIYFVSSSLILVHRSPLVAS